MLRLARCLRPVLALTLIVLAPLRAYAQDSWFETPGAAIHYVDMGGPGSPVVLLHSFMSSSEMWRNAGFSRSEKYRYIAVDMRGHGQSGKPTDSADYGIRMVEDVLALLDHLDIPRAHVVGYSMGAEVALRLAVEQPSYVRSLVVGGSGWSSAQENEVYQQVGDSLRTSDNLEAWFRAMSSDLTDEMFSFMVATLERHGIGLEGQEVAALSAAALGMDELIDLSHEELSGISVAVLGVAGENDPERANVERLSEVVPDFTMLVIPGTEHLDAVLNASFHDGIIAFLDRHP